MKVFDVVLREPQVLRPPQIFLFIAVVFTPPSVKARNYYSEIFTLNIEYLHDDGGVRDGSVLLLPLLDVPHGEHRVGVDLSPGLDADLDGGTGESLQGNVRRVPAVLVADWSTSMSRTVLRNYFASSLMP